MAEAPVTTAVPPGGGAQNGPTITQRRSLPGGRAVVGAFLVVLAAVGTFGAYLQATAEPGTSYVVATRALEVGEVLTEQDVTDAFRTVPIDLPQEQSQQVVRASQLASLAGTVVVAPVRPGDVVNISAVQPVGTAERGVQLSFSLTPDRAVAGRVAVGERVDVIGTFRGPGVDGTVTRVVARQVTVVANPAQAEGITGGRVVLTVQVPDLATAQALQHAVDVADVAILRGADPATADPAPATATELRPATDREPTPAPTASASAQDGGGA